MSKAEIFYEPSGCNCGGKSDYTKADINNAASKALELASQGSTLGILYTFSIRDLPLISPLRQGQVSSYLQRL